MITLSNVTKRFGKVMAVQNASFAVAPGQAVALWGSNGAGKTTLIRCVLGILRCRGEIRVDGISVKKRGKVVRSRIGYVPQELAFHDDMRLGSAMIFFASLRDCDAARCRELLDRVGLAGHERKRVRDLSGGMKQRLALAVALLADPPAIILDEPTSNLDADGRGEVLETLANLKTQGKTIVFASHRPDEVIALADRVIVMEQGRVVRDTTPSEFWPSAAAVQTMRLHVSGHSKQSAATVLREAGHAVHLNGQGLCVTVSRDSKAAPINVLTRAQMEVRDFEMLDDLHTERESP